MPSQVTINQIADYILSFAQESGAFISHLKLQKLAYYAQAWHLALHDEPLFEGSFEAWIHGPVNTSLYERFRGYSYKNIELDVKRPELNESVKLFMDDLLEQYFPFDAYELERLSHQEAPWLNARGSLDPTMQCYKNISELDMKTFYKARVGI
jgi:uncharacterized phage-associated protein